MYVLGAACCQQIQIHKKLNIELNSTLSTFSSICPFLIELNFLNRYDPSSEKQERNRNDWMGAKAKAKARRLIRFLKLWKETETDLLKNCLTGRSSHFRSK